MLWTLAKWFLISIVVTTVFMIILLFKIKHEVPKYYKLPRSLYRYNKWVKKNHDSFSNKIKTDYNFNKDFQMKTKSEMKYILQWTAVDTYPFIFMKQGQTVFIDNKCPNTNCIVTNNRSYLEDITKFDAVLFHGPEVMSMSPSELPDKRGAHQKYVYANIESADNYPLCGFNNYFNWSWTYRLDSEVNWGYIVVRNDKDEVVGPKIDMHWMKVEDMDPVSDEIREKVKIKNKAAAWLVSNCDTNSQREVYGMMLQKMIKKFNLSIDVYGDCGKHNCSRINQTECDELVTRDYYFYLAFENSFSKYYVTEKLLIGLNNIVIPIVYGGANYTRFLPEGSYINGRVLGLRKLARTMIDLMHDQEKYLSYFKWKKYYKYHLMNARTDTNTYCNMCKILNNQEKMREVSIIKNFDKWWNPRGFPCF